MYLVVGCGLSGVVLAERIANVMGEKVLIIDKRKHIGGNCYDKIDEDTGIRYNLYGAHLFHTNNERVWNYVNSFDKWIRWEHTVVSYIQNVGYVPIPVNITTVNRLCSENLQSMEDMDIWLKKNQVSYATINNSEQMGKSRVGETLYKTLLYSYTIKQWNIDPSKLDASVLARIPVRNNHDTRYFSDKYQALPQNGYTEFIHNMLDHPNITIMLGTDFFEFRKKHDMSQFTQIIYTGPIDLYFSGAGYERLEYRSINFQVEKILNMNFFQPNSVVNYPEPNVPYTRIVEYKHFLDQKSNHTLIAKETTTDIGEPYYPVPTDRNKELFERYRKLADMEHNVHFVGRLANYKYYNMDQAILNALNYFDDHFKNHNGD